MKNKLLYFAVPLLLILSMTLINAQTVTSVAAGDATIKAAYDAATSGDILELTESGGIYTYGGSDKLQISKKITIRAKAGLAEKPILRQTKVSTSRRHFEVIAGGDLTLIGLELDGADGTTTTLSKDAVRLVTGDSSSINFSMEDCYVHDFTEPFIKAYGKTVVDTFLVNNSVFENGAREGIMLYESSSAGGPGVHYAKISNITMFNVVREGIKVDRVTDPNGTILVDQCTFYNIGHGNASVGSGKTLMYFRDIAGVTVQNSILAKHLSPDSPPDKLLRFQSTASLFKNSAVWNVNNDAISEGTVTDTVHMDPDFKDASTGDFTLPTTSTLLTFGTDGGAIGDPRWVPGPTVWPVAAGEATIKDAYDLALDGDILELTASGGIYTFSSSDKIEIKKKITIRAKAGLFEKPILRQQKPGSTSRRHFDVLAGGDLTLIGLEIDGTSGLDDGIFAKDAVRLNSGDLSVVNLRVEDCYIHDFTEPFIKGYGNTSIDSILVKNTVFANGGREGIMLYENSTNGGPDVKYSEFSNITMSNVVREGIKFDRVKDTLGIVLIDRGTFYNIGHGNAVVGKGKSVMYFRDIPGVTVQNSIIAKADNPDSPPDKLLRFQSATSIFTKSVVWDVTNDTISEGTVTDTLHVDPAFQAAASGNFMLPVGSALLTFAIDGGSIGDPRWDPANIPTFELIVDVVGEGTVAQSPDLAEYNLGTEVTMTATPATAWKFDKWSDNITVFPANNPVAKVTMTKSIEATAYFVPDANSYTVGISSVGYGHVDDTTYSVYGDIDGFYGGDSVVMAAVVDSTNWEFAYWANSAGDSVTNVTPIYYNVAADTAFTAMFRSTLDQFTLTVTEVGSDGGKLTVSPKPVPGFTTYDTGTEITLIADAILGWDFSGYTGGTTGTSDTLVITLTADLAVTATFAEIAHANGILSIDDTWEMQDALDYAHNNTQVDTIMLTSVGPYLPDEADRGSSNGRMEYLELNSPIAIVGDPALATKPVIKGYTSSTGSNSSSGFFRFRAGSGKLTLRNLALDGSYDSAEKYNAKYMFRVDDGSDSVFCSIDAKDVEMYNCNEAFWKNYGKAFVDTIRFENAYVHNVGKEGFYLKAVGNVKHIEITNSTFNHVNRQIVYMLGMSPSVVIDHVTIDSSGYGFGTEGAKFPAFRIEDNDDVTISNSIISNVPYSTSTSGYVIRISGAASTVENVLFFNTPSKIDLKDDATIGDGNFWYDPMFVGVDSANFTLADSSIAYHMAGDGTAAVGDLNWATSTAIASYFGLDLTVGDHGDVTPDVEPMGKFYVPSTVVTLTAKADTLYKLGAWTGDATSSTNTAAITMDADKSAGITFDAAYFAVLLNVDMSFWVGESKFDPAADTVIVLRGSHETELADSDGDSIYSGTIKIDEDVPAFDWNFAILSSSNAHAETVTRSFTATEDTTLSFWYNYDDPALEIAGDLQPLTYELSQNYPNPFNPNTTINFALVNPGMTTLKVYDIMGREIATLISGEMKAGHHSINFHIQNLASGMYIYRLESGSFRAVKKMIMMK